jgi:hypothetical protein
MYLENAGVGGGQTAGDVDRKGFRSPAKPNRASAEQVDANDPALEMRRARPQRSDLGQVRWFAKRNRV